LTTLCALAAEALDRPLTLDIPPNTRLDDALIEWGTKATMTVMVNTPLVEHQTTQGFRGTVSAGTALSELLRQSGLSYTAEDGRIRVIPSTTLMRSAQQDEHWQSVSMPNSGTERPANPANANAANTNAANNAQKKADAANGNTQQDARRKELEEILVTAQKRSERLQDVPVPVTALSADILLDSNQLRLQDYYTTVPGLDVTPVRPAYQTISIRGITTGAFTNPTVGIMVDDMPYGSSADLGGSAGVPDIDPFDLSRVEVLRGPQGTLYGSSSMGGLIKFVTVDPSTDALSGRMQAGTTRIHNAADAGYNVRGAVNVPLTDTLAFRMSGFYREDPGYIDNPVLHINDLNKDDAYGGHWSGLWRPSESLSLKVSALFQEIKGYGHPDVVVESGLGDLQQNYVRGVGGNSRKVQAYSATVNAMLGSVNLTAVSGYSVNAITDSVDYSYVFGPLSEAFFGVLGAPLTFDNRTNKHTEEIRLSAPIGQGIDWLFGAFYTHENSSYLEDVLAADPILGQRQSVGQVFSFRFPTDYDEYAAFADVTFHITDKLDVQIGGRESQIRQRYEASESAGPLTGSESPVVAPEIVSRANAFTYLLTPRFKVSSDLMMYARLASGYRAGGPNGALSPVQEYNPDKTENYEIGVKGNVLDHALSFDASLYYINWRNIQLTLIDPQTQGSYTANGGTAKSQGVEVSVESRPTKGLTIGAWISYDDAVLTREFPAASTAYGAAGDRLPYTSRLSGNISLDEEVPLPLNLIGFVGSTVSYVGGREGNFKGTSTEQRGNLAAYAKTDLRAGVRYESWTVNVFANNVTDKRGLIAGGSDAIPPNAFIYIQPRTIGISVVKGF